MQKHSLANLTRGFDVLSETSRSQSAIMILQPRTNTGGPDNRHPESDQWLYVISGSATAVIEGKQVPLTTGDLLLIEANESHEIRNPHDQPFKTVNIYAPPEF